MNKFAALTIAGLLVLNLSMAQSVQEGVNHLYAERYQSAKATFEKLLASNPNNIEATYWLGQTHILMEDHAAAKSLYQKSLAANSNPPLILVGMGQVELLENKVNEARQRFESAITMTHTRRGDDPNILNAVGRAITLSYNAKEKTGGDINYAVQKLQAAAERDSKNPDIYLNLGNAIRKAKPGEGGGEAFLNYQKAVDVDGNFAIGYYRMAQLFSSQRNWELFEKYLNDAVSKDPKFAPAYYDLYYHKLGRLDFDAAEQFAKKYIENSDPDTQNDYLRVQTLWAKKDFAGAIRGAKDIIGKAGAATRARVYKLIADSYMQMKDTAAAKEYVDMYFKKAKADELTANDYQMKASAYSVIPGQEDVVFNSYVEGVKADTVMEHKLELLKKGADFFKDRGQREKEGDILSLLIDLKPKPTINEYFDVGRAYYFGGAYEKSYKAFSKFAEIYPDEVYGWEWKLNNSKIIDTTRVDSLAVPDALKLLEFSAKDTAKYKRQFISAASFLAIYYANKVGDREKAIEYLKKWQSVDPENSETIQKNIDILLKASGSLPGKYRRPALETA